VSDNIFKRGRGRPRIEDSRLWEVIPLSDKIERVNRARLVLRRMTPHAIDRHFNMSFWGEKTPCGTTGCAAGQCALDPWFQRRGFSMSFKETGMMLWTGLYPANFFGDDLYEQVFVNDKIMSYEAKNGAIEQRKPSAQHRLALRGINQYLKQLKASA
jgi:hypothetical protein